MAYICELGSIDRQPAITIRSRVTDDEFPDIFESSFARLIAYLEQIGEDLAGPPFAIYYDIMLEELDVEMCLPITKMVPGDGEITCREIGIENAASTVHTGPYEDIEPAYEALADWMFENGYEPIGTAYEFYLNDPGTTSSEDLQTVIFMPVVNMQGPEKPE
ncbi:MAG: GyrI-like domain-containing protein [Syntrophorhabdaceae bacterium]